MCINNGKDEEEDCTSCRLVLDVLDLGKVSENLPCLWNQREYALEMVNEVEEGFSSASGLVMKDEITKSLVG